MNYPPNTAFRGFGGPQGVIVIESILQQIAQLLNKDSVDIRRLNAYRDGDEQANTTPFGQMIKDHMIVESIDQLVTTSDYHKRVAVIDSHNAPSRLTVKGIAMSTIKFGISFTSKFLNQGNALVNVYTDGTGQGTPFFYFTTGAAIAEVTIDRFTGELTVDRVDLLMDVGKMINPGIDIGQIIGGFVQGIGWCTNEELVYDSTGKLLSTSPTTYKIPNVTDIPAVFNVATIDNPKHVINVSRLVRCS